MYKHVYKLTFVKPGKTLFETNKMNT